MCLRYKALQLGDKSIPSGRVRKAQLHPGYGVNRDAEIPHRCEHARKVCVRPLQKLIHELDMRVPGV